MASHARCDSVRLAGTENAAFLVNIKIDADYDNGSVFKLGEPAEGEAEAFAVVAPAADTELHDLVLLLEPEVMYDERLKSLHDFYNKADAVCRAYLLRHGDEFGLSVEGFAGTPEIGKFVAPAADSKWTVGTSGIGKIVAQYGELFIVRIA